MPDKKVQALDADALHMVIVHEIAQLKRLTNNPQPFRDILHEVTGKVHDIALNMYMKSEEDDLDDEE